MARISGTHNSWWFRAVEASSGSEQVLDAYRNHYQADDLLIRRLVLEPGEAMPWHTDACHRFSVVVRGDAWSIQMRDTGERITVAVHRGLAEWDQPQAPVRRGVNTGTVSYEEVVIFFLSRPGMNPQPEAA